MAPDDELDDELKELFGANYQEEKEYLSGALQDRVNEYAHKRATLSPHEYARWLVAKRANLLSRLVEAGAPRTTLENDLSQLIKAVEELRTFE